MPDTNVSKPATPRSDAKFATTHWTLVLAAGSPDSSRHREALQTLCQTYWFPLYAFLRRRGYNSNDAEEHTQAFFCRMLEKEYLREVAPRPGRFRSFLLTAFKNFLANERDRAKALKRGGNRTFIRLDTDLAEHQYSLEPVHQLSPERLFEKSWALTVLNHTMESLETELTDEGKKAIFDHLKVYLGVEGDAQRYKDVATKLNMSEGAIKVAVHRMRKRYRQLLREEIAQTVATRDEIDQEIQDLLDCIRD